MVNGGHWKLDMFFSPDGKYLVEERGSLNIYDCGTGKRRASTRSFEGLGTVISAAFLPDGNHLVIGHQHNGVSYVRIQRLPWASSTRIERRSEDSSGGR